MTDPTFSIDHHPPAADLSFLEDRLYDHNREATGKDDGRLFALTLRDTGGEIVAGLHGWTWAQACEIRVLWVHPARRGQGLGAALLRAAEAEARAQGCQVITLNSYSFQAPKFYQKYGYRVLARLADFPPGFEYFVFEKRLI